MEARYYRINLNNKILSRKTVKIWDQELIVGCSGMIMKQRMR